MILKSVIFALFATLCNAVINDPNVQRPCILGDVACIRNSLRSQSRCQPAWGSAPAVLMVPQARFDTPAFNASYTDNNMLIRGLDRCFVSEYYMNRRTNGKVLAFDCPWLTFESNRIMYQHYPRQEDMIYRYFINGTYPLITLTVQLTRADSDLCQEYSDVHVHALPIFNISPLDLPTRNTLTRDLSALAVFEQETFACRSQFLARTIINNKLCNFGCN